MPTFLHMVERLAREFRKRFEETKKAHRPHPMTWQKIKELWLLVRAAGLRFEPQPTCNGTHYAYTPDLRKLQQNKFRIIAGSNAPPAVVSSTRKNQNIKNLKHFIK